MLIPRFPQFVRPWAGRPAVLLIVFTSDNAFRWMLADCKGLINFQGMRVRPSHGICAYAHVQEPASVDLCDLSEPELAIDSCILHSMHLSNKRLPRVKVRGS